MSIQILILGRQRAWPVKPNVRSHSDLDSGPALTSVPKQRRAHGQPKRHCGPHQQHTAHDEERRDHVEDVGLVPGVEELCGLGGGELGGGRSADHASPSQALTLNRPKRLPRLLVPVTRQEWNQPVLERSNVPGVVVMGG